MTRNTHTQTYGNPDSPIVLVQPVDDHDLEEMEAEVSEIQRLTSMDFCLIAVKVRSWNQDLSPWKAPAVFGNRDFGNGAADFLRNITELCSDPHKTYYLGGYSLAGLFSLWAAYQTSLFAGIAGLIVGIPVLRLKGDYLAIVTLAFGEIIKNIINVLYIGLDEKGLHFSLLEQHFTLAEGGSMIINGPMGVGGVQKLSTFSSGVVLILITLFLVLNLIHSRTGRAIMAVRDNKIAAESIGLSVTRYKLLAFVISAVFAGMAGTLYAMNFSTVTASKFDFNTSILILVFVVLGGLGNIWGSIIAAALLTVLPELLRSMNDYRMLIYAILLIVMMIFNNSGAKKRLTEYFSAQKEKRTAKKAAGKGVN